MIVIVRDWIDWARLRSHVKWTDESTVLFNECHQEAKDFKNVDELILNLGKYTVGETTRSETTGCPLGLCSQF